MWGGVGWGCWRWGMHELMQERMQEISGCNDMSGWLLAGGQTIPGAQKEGEGGGGPPLTPQYWPYLGRFGFILGREVGGMGGFGRQWGRVKFLFDGKENQKQFAHILHPDNDLDYFSNSGTPSQQSDYTTFNTPGSSARKTVRSTESPR